MRIAITGARGFMGRNLQLRLREQGHDDLVVIAHDATSDDMRQLLADVTWVFHLAGVNRPLDVQAFEQGNLGFTQRLCQAMAAQPQPPAVVYASSTQAALDNPYGRSKRAAEEALREHGQVQGAPVHLFRLPNVFGKWSRPQYNSAVATFCHQIARGLPITVHDPKAALSLVYIDDVLSRFTALLTEDRQGVNFDSVAPQYDITVGELAATLQRFRDSRNDLLSERVGTGLTRALYATYVSFLPEEAFHYDVPRHADPRGVFVEMLKTPDCGQFSYFTAHPGITRGEHYHHTKTEKFLVIRGTARFGFRHVQTQATHELTVQGGEGRIVETVPGWTHNVTNVGDDELIVMLWANEIFDRERPDTTALKVQP